MYLPKVNRLFYIAFYVNNNQIFSEKKRFSKCKKDIYILLTFTHQSLPKQSFGFWGGFENMKIPKITKQPYLNILLGTHSIFALYLEKKIPTEKQQNESKKCVFICVGELEVLFEYSTSINHHSNCDSFYILFLKL